MVCRWSSLLLASLSSACDPLPTRQSPPHDVRDLRIDDFKIVMAMGDSMTAGFNGDAKADMHEHRGLSFSIGGDKDAVTIPNMIKAVKTNGDLVGAAIGTLSQPTIKATCADNDVDVCRLSAAVDGSDLQNLIDLQVPYLNHTLNTATWAENVSIQDDWKLLTIFSGLDDVVFYNATDPAKKPTSPGLFKTNLDKLLHAIHSAFPKTFVSLLLLPEFFEPRITTSRFTCKFFKWYSEHNGIHWTNTDDWIAAIKENNKIIAETALAWNTKGLDDFGIGLQPFMQEAPLQETDMDTLDCFHPNLATQQGMAMGLWNNMLTASSSVKSTNWKQQLNATCPSSESRLTLYSSLQILV